MGIDDTEMRPDESEGLGDVPATEAEMALEDLKFEPIAKIMRECHERDTWPSPKFLNDAEAIGHQALADKRENTQHFQDVMAKDARGRELDDEEKGDREEFYRRHEKRTEG